MSDTMIADLPLHTIPPARAHTHTVIFLHRNRHFARETVNQLHEATDLSWRSIIQNYASTRWVFPQTPTDEPLMPSLLSISTGVQHAVQRGEPSWWQEAVNDEDEKDEAERLWDMMHGLGRRMRELQKVIRKEVVMLGGRWDRVILGGIGHGAGMALMTLINLDDTSSPGISDDDRPQPLGSFIGISAELPASIPTLISTPLLTPNEVSPEGPQVLKKTPMLLQHFHNGGTSYMQRGRALREYLRHSAGVEVVCWKEYMNGWPYLNSPTGVEDMKAFLKEKMDMRTNW
jgi:predicted esterase